MKKSLILVSVGAALALAGCSKSTRSDTVATDTTVTPPAQTTTVGQKVDNATARTGEAVADAGRAIQRGADNTADAMRRGTNEMSAEWREWKLSNTDLDADLRANKPIIRTRPIPMGAPAGAVNVNKSQIKDNVKANVAKHAAAIKDLDVEIDNETEVVLTGRTMTVDEVGKAIGSALSTAGVTKVTSKIKLDK